MVDTSGSTAWTYDEFGRLSVAVDPAGKRITYAYDAAGRRDHMTEPDGGRFTYSYDLAGRTEYLVNPHDERTTFAHDAAGRPESQILGNNTRTSYTYDDAAGRTTKVDNLTSTGTMISSFDYAYDNVGNRTRQIEVDGSRVTWTYDKLYRLESEHRDQALAWEWFTAAGWDELSPDGWSDKEVSGTQGGYRITQTYDPVGNRLLKEDNGARVTYTYDAGNQLETSKTASETTTYTYDATGNLELQETLSGRTTYTWDIENRLSRLWLPSGVRNTMVYNADGQRVQKEDTDGTSKFVWDLRNILLETNAAGATQGQFTLQPDTFGNLISQRRGASSHFHHFDALGSTAGLTDASQVLTDSYLYKAYGEILAKSGSTTNPFRWVGRQGYFYDSDLAQYYVRARHYDPRIARWLSEDLWGTHLPSGLYNYGGNRPTFALDPSGLIPQAVCDVIAHGCFAKGLACVCAIIGIIDAIMSYVPPQVAPQIQMAVNLLDCACDLLAIMVAECGECLPVAGTLEAGTGAVLSCLWNMAEVLGGPLFSGGGGIQVDVGGTYPPGGQSLAGLAALLQMLFEAMSEAGLEASGVGGGWRACIEFIAHGVYHQDMGNWLREGCP